MNTSTTTTFAPIAGPIAAPAVVPSNPPAIAPATVILQAPNSQSKLRFSLYAWEADEELRPLGVKGSVCKIISDPSFPAAVIVSNTVITTVALSLEEAPYKHGQFRSERGKFIEKLESALELCALKGFPIRKVEKRVDLVPMIMVILGIPDKALWSEVPILQATRAVAETATRNILWVDRSAKDRNDFLALSEFLFLLLALLLS
jgi:hypothetical protein